MRGPKNLKNRCAAGDSRWASPARIVCVYLIGTQAGSFVTQYVVGWFPWRLQLLLGVIILAPALVFTGSVLLRRAGLMDRLPWERGRTDKGGNRVETE